MIRLKSKNTDDKLYLYNSIQEVPKVDGPVVGFELQRRSEAEFVCLCGGVMEPAKGGYHPGIMVLKCGRCGRAAERPCTHAGQAGYCEFCGEQLDGYMNV